MLPEPTPPVTGRAAARLRRRLARPEASPEVLEVFRGAREVYRQKRPPP